MTRRHEDWEQRLNRCIAEARTRSFAWGEFDCAKWVCEVIETLTGKDCYAEFREKYCDRASMVRAIREYGSLAELAEQVAKEYELREVPVKLAGRGDVVLVNGEFNSLAIVDGVYALGASHKGLARVPRKSWLKAWKVD
jgi:hypothetical protein